MTTRAMLIWGAAATLAACGGHAATDEVPPGPTQSVAESLASTCSSATASGGWVNGALGSHTGSFTVDVDLTPSAAPSDALFGLASGAASTYANLADIIRFNPSGLVDVRNGSSYAADQAVPYQAGRPLHFSIDVNAAGHTYSVRQASTVIASNYAFRSEQSGTSLLDHYALKVDAGGSLDACNVSVSDACRAAAPNGGFQDSAFAAQAVFFASTFSATASAAGIDGVVGFSSTNAARFDDLAAAVRFNSDGKIDVRNGTTYAADSSVTYTPGTTYTFDVLIDVLGHSYSVLVDGEPIAKDYAFRPQQAGVTSLANWAVISDSGVGAMTVCDLQVLPAVDASYLHSSAPYGERKLAALAGGSVALASASDTVVLDGTGRAVATLAHGGTPGSDATGDLYLAGEFQGSYDGGGGAIPSQGGTDVYLSKYDSAKQPLWTRALGSDGEDTLGTLSVNAEGDSLVGVGAQMIRLGPDGASVWSVPLTAADEKYAIDPNGGAFLLEARTPDSESFSVTHLDASGNTAWTRSFHEQGASLRFVRSDPSGNVIVSGGLNGSIDFGATTLRASAGEDGSQVFIAKLDQTGTYAWAAVADMQSVTAMEVDGAGRPVLSGYLVNPVQFRLIRYSASGSVDLSEDGSRLTGGIGFGTGRDLAVNAAGDVFWQFEIDRPAENLGYLTRIVR